MPALARDLAAIHRLEFPFSVNYLCYATWGAAVAAGDPARLADPAVPAAVIANLLLIVAALALNTAADTRTDTRHPERSAVAAALRRVGRRRVIGLATAELAVALLLAGAVAAGTGRPMILAAAVLAVVLQVLYNLDPVRLKRRGLPGVVAFCAAVFVLPFLLAHWAVRPGVDPASWPVAGGLGILAVARMTLWSVPDRAADTAAGLGTPAARHGPAGAAALSLTAFVTGLTLTGWGLWRQYGLGWAVPLVTLQAWPASTAATVLRHPHSPTDSWHLRHRAFPPATLAMIGMTVAPLT
ncbi:UbiA family prenyltransferase [Actinophytocola sp.]|uniref:UbiA family prenyltransferase n=1 Tax=Actinophytocola sp. TaxID=1872138 RepID=UPI002D808B03|nr:UbiA family prenyltransferase [Actinophytocola sp.]HET9142824.1 UbiA family prenyltransferase [Actinophytocola sp.]